jgi:uncharacterized protein YdeI (YjbR/CyaY-like superfamily)
VSTAEDPRPIRAFRTAAPFERWLAPNHARADELFVRIFKKGSSTPTITYAEALDVALCWGWIDAVKHRFDDVSFLQRFTPRRARSIWSTRNQAHVERLIATGRMQPPGLAQVTAAKADGRWARAYDGQATMQLPPALATAIAASPPATRALAALPRAERFALAFRVHQLKTDAGRTRAIASIVASLEARGAQR